MEPIADYDVTEYLELTKPWNEDANNFLSRYYTYYYKKGNQGVDVYVRQTPSKICVIGMAEPPKEISRIKLNTELIGNKVKQDSVLCELYQQETLVGIVRAEMEGKLLELNTRYENEPIQTLLNQHLDIGFIGIILPKSEDSKIQLRDFELKTLH